MSIWYSDCWIKKHASTLVLVIAYSVIAVLSWMPGDIRPQTVLQSGNLEHQLAYLLLGGLTTGLKRQTLNAYWLVPIVVGFAGAMELGQLLIPTRTASLDNFGASALGAVIGIFLLSSLMRRSPPALRQ